MWGCSGGSYERHRAGPDHELQKLVGQTVTLRGQFEIAGKFGPYIHRNGKSIYLLPHGSLDRGSNYELLQGKVVSVTGILRFQHSEHVVDESVAQPPDYFYFDAETANLRVE